MKTATRVLVFAAVVLLLLAVAGCYESQFTLGPRNRALFDPAYVGDWEVRSGIWADSRLLIRRSDENTYYVEWGKRGDTMLRMSGFVIDVQGANFAHLCKLGEDGSLTEKYLILRVAIVGGKLSIRPLDDKFFALRPVHNSEQFLKLVEENLENEQMYDRDTPATADRVSGIARRPSASAGSVP